MLPICLSFEIYEYAQILITRHYIILTNFLICYEIKTHFGDTL